MVSAAEQLSASLTLSNFSRATELKARIWFTLGALIIYRLGTYIPVPGLDASVLKGVFDNYPPAFWVFLMPLRGALWGGCRFLP